MKPGPDEVISYLDRNAALSHTIIGALSEDEWSQFWHDLDEFVAILYEKYISSLPLRTFNSIRDYGYDTLEGCLSKGNFDQLVNGDDKYISGKCLDLALQS